MDKTEIKTRIAARIKGFRTAHNISQEDLAGQINTMITEYLEIPSHISKATVSQWERGVFQPDPLLFATIAAVENVPSEWETTLQELASDIRSTQNGLTWQE